MPFKVKLYFFQYGFYLVQIFRVDTELCLFTAGDHFGMMSRSDAGIDADGYFSAGIQTPEHF
jgi:hypothetical protein